MGLWGQEKTSSVKIRILVIFINHLDGVISFNDPSKLAEVLPPGFHGFTLDPVRPLNILWRVFSSHVIHNPYILMLICLTGRGC